MIDTERAHVDFNAQFLILRTMWARLDEQARKKTDDAEIRRLVVSVREQAKTFLDATEKTFVKVR